MNSARDHPSRQRLAAFLGGQLESSELALIASHIDACDVCGQALREIPDDELVARLRDASSTVGADEVAPVPQQGVAVPQVLLDHPKYKVGRFLGRGGMGAVYQAEHRLMNRQVALKIIHPRLTKNKRVIERFHQEVKAAASLAHPNIVTAYDAEQAGDLHFLIMEYVDGMSLARLVAKKGPMEVAYACHFVRQAAKGLQHAFESGMVHRDIKPHNLMLTRKGQIKILDFGMARLATESLAELELAAGADLPTLLKPGEIMGTPGYIAPEQIVDPAKADIRADIYSLGCTLYFLLTGQTPFPDIMSRQALLTPETRQPRPIHELRADLPAGLIAVLNRMISCDPARRYATPDNVIKALAPLAKAAPISSAATEPACSGKLPVAPTPAPAHDTSTFLAQCPFCKSKYRIPNKAFGASISCPNCSSFFTAAP